MGRKYQYSAVLEAFIKVEPEVEDMLERIYEQVQRERAESPVERAFRLGQVSLLARQLRFKFGPAAMVEQAALERASSRQLEIWAERVFGAETLSAIFHDDDPG